MLKVLVVIGNKTLYYSGCFVEYNKDMNMYLIKSVENQKVIAKYSSSVMIEETEVE